MKRTAAIFFGFFFFSLSPVLLGAEEKVEVKANLPGVQVEYEKGPKDPPPQEPVRVVEKQVVQEPEKKGCSCNLIPTTTADQALIGLAFFITLGLVPRLAFQSSSKFRFLKNPPAPK